MFCVGFGLGDRLISRLFSHFGPVPPNASAVWRVACRFATMSCPRCNSGVQPHAVGLLTDACDPISSPFHVSSTGSIVVFGGYDGKRVVQSSEILAVKREAGTKQAEVPAAPPGGGGGPTGPPCGCFGPLIGGIIGGGFAPPWFGVPAGG